MSFFVGSSLGRSPGKAVALPPMPRVAEGRAATGDHISLTGESPPSLGTAVVCSRWDGSAMLSQRAAKSCVSDTCVVFYLTSTQKSAEGMDLIQTSNCRG